MPVASRKTGRSQVAATVLILGAIVLTGYGSGILKVLAMSDEVRSLCQQAEQLIDAQRFSDAIALLQRAGSTDPNCPEVHGYLGEAYQNSGKTRQALDEYNRALQLNPQMTFLSINIGTCYMNLNQLDQAVPYFQQYLQQNPNAPDANQVRMYIQQAGSRKGQQDLHGLMDQGQALLKQHRNAEAVRVFQQAVTAQPNWAPAHFYLGYALAQSGDHQGAINQLQSALQLDPTTKEAVLDIGSSYQSLGDSGSAIAWYQRYLQENPGSPKAGDIRKRINGLREQASKQGHTSGQVASTQPSYRTRASASGANQSPSPPPAPAQTSSPSQSWAAEPGGDPYEGLVPPQQSTVQPTYPSSSRPSTYATASATGPNPSWSHPAVQASAAPAAEADNYLEEATKDGKYFRWPADKMPIKIFVSSGAGDASYRPSFTRVLNESLNAWSQASNNSIAFWSVADPSQADIDCQWTNNPASVEESKTSDEGGLTRLSGQEQPNGIDVKITRAKVILFTRGSGGAPISDDDMKKVCLHEIGHALGLNGHSANNHDVMFYSESTSVWPSLTKRDKATISKLYSGYPKLVGAQER